MLILDANVLVSAVVGRSDALIGATADRGVGLLVTEAQLGEARRVLVGKLGRPRLAVEAALVQLGAFVRTLEPEIYESSEAAARTRLHERAQPDWPTLAAAIALGADVWSNDRDFFGVGVAVWSTRNVVHAVPDEA